MLAGALLCIASPSAGRQDGPAGAARRADDAAAVPRLAPWLAHPIRVSRIALPTGVTIEVAEAGPADGEPVLFLHGYTDSWVSWSLVLEQLPRGIRAIAATTRGHGDSDRPACCYRIQDFAEDAVALLDVLKLDRVTVVGHSMGSFIAQQIAIAHPERVSRLVLVGSGATTRQPATAELAGMVQGLGDPVDIEFIREFQASTAAAPLPGGFLDRIVAESAKLPARVWRDTFDGIVAFDGERRLDRIKAPTLIIWGEEETYFPRETQEALARAIPGSRLLGYPGIGHAPNWEQPQRLIADQLAFMAQK
jgi:pimeloyl-ACP methyl ester carboxylesterase